MAMRRIVIKRLSVFIVLITLALGAALPAAAQSTVPDMTQFGFPQVTGTVNFTPGKATSLTAGDQRVDLPADMLSTPVKFEFLEGDPAFFHQNLEADDASKQVLATFAFRVTDMNTGQLVGRFDKPVTWSITSSQVTSESEVYNSSAANPPKITENSTPGTVAGTTLTHNFGGAGVGWLVLGPQPVGMPATGAPDGTTNGLVLATLLGALALSSGLVVRRLAHRRA